MKTDIIIGIAGTANSGKDTVASMINFIYKYRTAANYGKWLMEKEKIETNIFHFADPLKECLSIMFGIDKTMFYDRKYKDEYLYVFSERRFIDYKIAQNYFIIEHSDLDQNPLSYYIDKPKACITLRTLLQYFGTDICRENLDYDIWIKATLRKAVDWCKWNRVAVIADVRFNNETEAIRHRHKGIVIKLTRNINKNSHKSENINFECDYEIENNGTLQQLFYKVLEIIQNL